LFSTTSDGSTSRKINYPGTGNYSAFFYDGFDENVSITQFASGVASGTKKFLWCNQDMCQSTNGSGAIISLYFVFGQTLASQNYFYTKDRLGSVRELTDNSGNIQAQYEYDPFGKVTRLQGSLNSDFQFTSAYYDLRSALNLTLHRSYSPTLGRFLNRDPIEENGGTNLYGTLSTIL